MHCSVLHQMINGPYRYALLVTPHEERQERVLLQVDEVLKSLCSCAAGLPLSQGRPGLIMNIADSYFVEELRDKLGSSAARAWFHELANARLDASADCEAAADLKYYMAGLVGDVMRARIAERYSQLVLLSNRWNDAGCDDADLSQHDMIVGLKMRSRLAKKNSLIRFHNLVVERTDKEE